MNSVIPADLDSRTSTVRRLSGSTSKAVFATVGASIFVALCAHLTVPLPFTPVPLTLSDFAVLLVGLTLGPELGFAAIILYLLEGAAGFPVFAPSGPGGLAQLRGITAGYLVAYPFAAVLTGYLARRLHALASGKLSRYTAAALAATAGTALIMISGAAWLGLFTHHDAALTFKLAVLPFLPGQVIKIAAAAGIVTAWKSRASN